MVQWCKQDAGDTCGWFDMTFYKQCALNAPTQSHQMQQEAKFWVGVYRCLNEERLNDVLAPDDLLNRVLSGQRCYFLRWNAWPENMFPTYKQHIDDFLEELKATSWGGFEKHLNAQTKKSFGLDGRAYKMFNPFYRALGVWCIEHDIKSIKAAQGEAGGNTILHGELEKIPDDAYFSKIIEGTKGCISRRRICPVPAKQTDSA